MRHNEPMSEHPGRDSYRYRELKKVFRARCELANTPCWLDGQPINYALPPNHPESYSLDHRISVAKRPDLLADYNNFAASHLVCNQRRGDGRERRHEPIQIGEPSEEW